MIKRSQILDRGTRLKRNADVRLVGRRPLQLALDALLMALVLGVLGATQALAVSAPIQIANTGGEGVFIRSEPNSASTRLGATRPGWGLSYAHRMLWRDGSLSPGAALA